MAFMLEGGLQNIEGSKIGGTALLPDVKRSVTFRCIPYKENICKLKVSKMNSHLLISYIAAGSKIFNMVKPRVDEDGKFFLDIYNYDGM